MGIETAIASLHDVIKSIPEDIRAYAVRFENANRNLSTEALLLKWQGDQDDRAQAAALEKHRIEKVIGDLKDLTGDQQKEVLAALVGVEANGTATDTNNE